MKVETAVQRSNLGKAVSLLKFGLPFLKLGLNAMLHMNTEILVHGFISSHGYLRLSLGHTVYSQGRGIAITSTFPQNSVLTGSHPTIKT